MLGSVEPYIFSLSFCLCNKSSFYLLSRQEDKSYKGRRGHADLLGACGKLLLGLFDNCNMRAVFCDIFGILDCISFNFD